MLHYASPPVIGGVESTIAHHARALAENGHAVRVISGSGAAFDSHPLIAFHLEPLFASKHPDVLALKHDLDRGERPPGFDALTARMAAALRTALAGCDVCIAHNVHTLNKNLALTAALRQIDDVRHIAWCHDLAWTNPQYAPELYERDPWTLLRQPQPGTRYVTISEVRRAELAALMGLPPDSIPVIPGGIDPARFFQWTPEMTHITARLNLLDADGLLLLPARLTRRKNIALGLHVLAALRLRTNADYRLIVTGPPGPHNPANPGYLGELLALRAALGLQNAVHFLYELTDPPLMVDDATIANLYQLADALFFPSLQEGFGLPVLEAGLAGIPVFCADLPVLRETGGADVHPFDPETTAPGEIAAFIAETLAGSPSARLRVRVRQRYRWSHIVRSQLIPLLEAP
ncbi:MAG: glycosyltransferase family 4 protein [bacterium]|nr:glycosyltransferase family 4 protein [bacterium]